MLLFTLEGMIMRKQRIKIVGLLTLCFIVLSLSIAYSSLSATLSFDSSAIVSSPTIEGTCKLVNAESIVFGSSVFCGNESFHVVGRDDTNNTFVLAGDYPTRIREPYNQIVYNNTNDYLSECVSLEAAEGKMDVAKLASLYHGYLQNILKLENVSVCLLNNDSFVGYNDGSGTFLDMLDAGANWLFGAPTFTNVSAEIYFSIFGGLGLSEEQIEERLKRMGLYPPSEFFLGVGDINEIDFVSIEQYNALLLKNGLDGFPMRFTITIPQNYIKINGGE